MRKSNKTNKAKYFKGHFLITLQSIPYVSKALFHKAPYPPTTTRILRGNG